MVQMLLAIAGKPGSGKSAVAEKLARFFNLELVSFGVAFRRKAKEMNFSLEEFERYAEEHVEVDKKIEEEQLKLIKKGNCVVDSRLGGHLAWKENVPSIKIYLKASLDVRAKRVAKRESIEMERAKLLVEERERSEKKRYREFYSIDIDDLSLYDLIINSELLTEEGLFEAVRTFIVNCRMPDGREL